MWARRFAAVSAIAVSLLLSYPCLAQDPNLVQSGTVQFRFHPGSGGAPGIWEGPDVTFPSQFGEVPTVTLSYVAPPPPFCMTVFLQFGEIRIVGPLPLRATNVTTRSFKPILPACDPSNCITPYLNPDTGSFNVAWTASGSPLYSGTAVPNYLVLTVIYAPPGTNGGRSSSSVSYQSGSSTGTITSVSDSFKSGVSVSIDASGGLFGTGGGVGTSFDASTAQNDTQSLQITKTTTSTITQVGPSQDGINHDEDEIWLLLNPTVTLQLSSSVAQWLLQSTAPVPVQYVHVGWLNGHEQMPAGVASALASAGISPAVYPNILARDPFANGNVAFDPSRFKMLNTTFPYEPPLSSGGPVPTTTFTISSNSVASAATDITDTYKVGVSVTGSAGFLDLFSVKIKDALSWEWTNKSTQSSSSSSSQSASVTIGGPAFGYSGPTLMMVYLDTIYNSFAFAVVPAVNQPVALRGVLITSDGRPLSYTSVIMSRAGKDHFTITNAKGEFTFYGDKTGSARIRTLDIDRNIEQLETAGRLLLQR
jgi:hypothetical protein